jgi:hypothetical protein
VIDYRRYYNLEPCLFEEVHHRFHAEQSLSAFDFFSIVIWKANRAKSKIARKLLHSADPQCDDLDAIVRSLTALLYAAPDSKSRLRILLCDWGFALPMATAILTVLWPGDFTVYDTRVCEQLGGFHDLRYRSDFERVWEGYELFVARVRSEAPQGFSLRDQDRFLFGKSTALQLEQDIMRRFRPNREEDSQ